MERIFYDLVANFNVFGNVSHQMLSRLYMDYLRMESEALFLSFIPKEEREKQLKSWYRGILAQVKIFFSHSSLLMEIPTKVNYATKSFTHEFLAQLRQRAAQTSRHDDRHDKTVSKKESHAQRLLQTVAMSDTPRTFVMSMGGMGSGGGMQFHINNKVFDINRIDETVPSGATEIWEISNTSQIAHPFHAHAIQWQILDRGTIGSTLVSASGIDLVWKDTVLVQPNETVRFIGKFDPTINYGKYMYHCHILEHEDNGMMGTFEVLH